MDANEVNKVAGAVLGMLTLAMGIGFFSGALVSPKPLVKAGYELPDNTGGDHGGGAGAAPAAAEKAEPIAKRMATADVAKGEASAKKCVSCHQFTKDGKNGTGPLLYGVLMRAKGAAPAFKYSAGLSGKGGNWDYAALDEFLTNPKAYVSGTTMGFAGIARADERANIIAYLRTMADAPAPMPQ